MTSWYTVSGVAYTVKATAQQEPWSIDACWRTSLHGAATIAGSSAQSETLDFGDDSPWWHWDPGGWIDERCGKRSVWDPGIEGSILGGLTQAHSSIQGFVWDPGIGSQLHRANRAAHIFGFLEGKQSWGGSSVIFLCLVSPMTGLEWTSRVRSKQVTGTGWCHQRAQGLFGRIFEEFL